LTLPEFQQRLVNNAFVAGISSRKQEKITRGQIGQVSKGGNVVSDPSGEPGNYWMYVYDLPSMRREMGKSYAHLGNFRFMKEFCHI